MGGGQRKTAFFLVTELLRNLLNAFYLTQNLASAFKNGFAGGSNSCQVLTAT
jgi:hypothetical protein